MVDAGFRKTFWLWLALLFLVSLLGVGLVDLFTFRPGMRGTVSGNGNPGFLVVMLWTPFYAALLVMVGAASRGVFSVRFRHDQHSAEWLIVILCLGGLMLGLSFLYADHVYNALGGHHGNPDSAIFRWSEPNQYTNTVYINCFTFGFGIACAILAGYLLALIRDKIK